jgi:hypothetical protein
MKEMAAAPAVSYILGFSPQNQKIDVSFHQLKVEVVGNAKYEMQARRGYYALKKSQDPQEQASAEIDEAILSREEILDIPMELQTQYFKKTPEETQVSVLTRLNVKDVHFRMVDKWNCNKLTIVTAVFDNNGNFIFGVQKNVNLKLSGPTYDHLISSGLTIKSNFDLKPGTYTLRQVVRGSEDSQMAARNGIVVIPN